MTILPTYIAEHANTPIMLMVLYIMATGFTIGVEIAYYGRQKDRYGAQLCNAHLAFTIIGTLTFALFSAVMWLWAAKYSETINARANKLTYGLCAIFLLRDLPLFCIEYHAILEEGWEDAYQGFAFIMTLLFFLLSGIYSWLNYLWVASRYMNNTFGDGDHAAGLKTGAEQLHVLAPASPTEAHSWDRDLLPPPLPGRGGSSSMPQSRVGSPRSNAGGGGGGGSVFSPTSFNGGAATSRNLSRRNSQSQFTEFDDSVAGSPYSGRNNGNGGGGGGFASPSSAAYGSGGGGGYSSYGSPPPVMGRGQSRGSGGMSFRDDSGEGYGYGGGGGHGYDNSNNGNGGGYVPPVAPPRDYNNYNGGGGVGSVEEQLNMLKTRQRGRRGSLGQQQYLGNSNGAASLQQQNQYDRSQSQYANRAGGISDNGRDYQSHQMLHQQQQPSSRPQSPRGGGISSPLRHPMPQQTHQYSHQHMTGSASGLADRVYMDGPPSGVRGPTSPSSPSPRGYDGGYSGNRHGNGHGGGGVSSPSRRAADNYHSPIHMSGQLSQPTSPSRGGGGGFVVERYSVV